MKKFLTAFVAFTHSSLYMDFIIHAPLAAAIVLGFRNWWAFVFAATIGLWKDCWIDRFYSPTDTSTTAGEAAVAAAMYLIGAVIGAFGWQLS